MAIDKIQSESINLADTFAFTGTVSGTPNDYVKITETVLSSNATYVSFTSSGSPNIFSSDYRKLHFYFSNWKGSGNATDNANLHYQFFALASRKNDLVTSDFFASLIDANNATNPIPANKNDIAACTAMAGEMLGLKVIYMDAGSGAKNAIPTSMIQQVAKQIKAPIIDGGGITTPEQAIENCKAGADIIVVGNAIEKDPLLIQKIADAIHGLN